ncbi:MAG: Fe-S cluster biogenesis protein NfuA [Parvicella sp.]|jgi:Fe-S cluster biogenesis protein NfuA
MGNLLNVLRKFEEMVDSKESLLQKVNVAIEQLRPYLHSDGGDMELVEITNENIVRVKLIGACKTCNMSAMTLKAGLSEALKSAAPDIKGVEAID